MWPWYSVGINLASRSVIQDNPTLSCPSFSNWCMSYGCGVSVPVNSGLVNQSLQSLQVIWIWLYAIMLYIVGPVESLDPKDVLHYYICTKGLCCYPTGSSKSIDSVLTPELKYRENKWLWTWSKDHRLLWSAIQCNPLRYRSSPNWSRAIYFHWSMISGFIWSGCVPILRKSSFVMWIVRYKLGYKLATRMSGIVRPGFQELWESPW